MTTDTREGHALDDDEIAVLDGFLARGKGGAIANVEALDGFVAALACCPDLVMPSEFLEVIQTGGTEGGTEAEDLVFDDPDEARLFVDLVMRHWGDVNDRLNSGEIYLPLLIDGAMDGADGARPANDWAQGFLAGMELRHEIWWEVFDDEERGGPLVPIMALAYETHPDPEMRPFREPISEEKRMDLIAAAAAGVMKLHAMLRDERDLYLPDLPPDMSPALPGDLSDHETFRHDGPRVGRNAPCPCGSGKKFKKCCGAGGPTLH